MGRLFGTDGIRGVANVELTCDLAFRLGQAAAIVLTEEAHHRPKILIGKDTRISSDMLEAAITAGICSVGGDVHSLSVIPTPAVAYLVKKYGADAGVMVSASHNPFEHNGIKLFSGEGLKLPDAIEDKIEQLMESGDVIPKSHAEIGRAFKVHSAVDDYVNHVYETVGTHFSGMKIAADCSNGSASATFDKLCRLLQVEALIINDQPNGININDRCGSTHLDVLSEFTVSNQCDFGIAFDGDADRMLAVDENGEEVDGDKLMAVFAKSLMDEGKLKNNTLVCTTMSNLGLYEMAKQYGINIRVTDVGDRYVLEEMLRGGYCLGGEASGHIIFADHATTGDGQMAAVQLMKIMAKNGRMSELAGLMEKYPQVMLNVRVKPEVKMNYAKDKDVTEAIKSVEQHLGDQGRIIVRASGTEPLVRVMIEGRDYDEINELAYKVAEKIKAV